MTIFDALSNYSLSRLKPKGRDKPLDFTGGDITGSLNLDARITSLNFFHTEYGYVTLTSAPPFPEDKRYEPDYVRKYRASLIALDGFGLHFEIPVIRRQFSLLEDAVPHIHLTFGNMQTADVYTFIPGETSAGVVQLWEFSDEHIVGSWRGRISLQRCAYTQLTEGGPIPPPPVQSEVSDDGQVITLENKALGQAVGITGIPQEGVFQYKEDGSVSFEMIFDSLPSKSMCIVYGFGKDRETARKQCITLHRSVTRKPDNSLFYLRRALDGWQERWRNWPFYHSPLNQVLRRALVYSWLCAVPVDGTTCLITDHQLLPLAWNRDSYYAARALMAWQPKMIDLVREHLLWMFEVAERPDGAWGRAYLVNGEVKDRAFQLDQQIFPLLEVTDYLEAQPDDLLLKRLGPHINTILNALFSRESDEGLYATDETPADDPVAMPYHLSSHILLWHTLRRLADVLQDMSLLEKAEKLQTVIWNHFITTHNNQSVFAYLTDGAGHHQLYHDANDFPLVLAPVWGFCAADNTTWRATMDFAFSPANVGGFYEGKHSGLGSVHTRAIWPLGDAQEYLYAKLTGDWLRQQKIIERILTAAQWDGSLPEAYDPDTAEVISRNWFAWPGAALYLCEINFAIRQSHP